MTRSLPSLIFSLAALALVTQRAHAACTGRPPYGPFNLVGGAKIWVGYDNNLLCMEVCSGLSGTLAQRWMGFGFTPGSTGQFMFDAELYILPVGSFSFRTGTYLTASSGRSPPARDSSIVVYDAVTGSFSGCAGDAMRFAMNVTDGATINPLAAGGNQMVFAQGPNLLASHSDRSGVCIKMIANGANVCLGACASCAAPSPTGTGSQTTTTSTSTSTSSSGSGNTITTTGFVQTNTITTTGSVNTISSTTGSSSTNNAGAAPLQQSTIMSLAAIASVAAFL